MANDYLIHKWRLWFGIFDVDKTGQFSRATEANHEEGFANLNNLTAERKKEVIAASKQMMEEHYFRGETGDLTEQTFVDMNNNEYKEDKNKFIERMRKLWNTDCDIMDLYQEGFITQEVFVNAFQAAGYANVDKAAKLFQSFGPKDQKIPVPVLVDALVHFTTSEDSSKPDLFREYLEGGL